MAAVDDDDFDSTSPASEPGRWQWFINVAGAATSIALVIGIGVWGYKLAVRDVTGIPVVRALEGPMRVAPQEPGGVVASNVGLSVNEIAEDGAAAPLPEEMVLAPRPIELSLEDQPVGAPAAEPANATLASLQVDPAADAALSPLVPVAPVEEPTVTPLADATASELAPDAMEAAVAGALAEVLAPESLEIAAEAEAPASDTLALIEPAPPGAVIRSPRPERRPEGDGSEEIVAVAVESTALVASGEVDAATLTPGTRLVQLGAFDDEADARAEWERLRVKFGDLIAPKTLVIQMAQSGGRSFVRLRALGFDDEADARRFCSALLAEDAACIPVTYRP